MARVMRVHLGSALKVVWVRSRKFTTLKQVDQKHWQQIKALK
jgi:hypothetical protein